MAKSKTAVTNAMRILKAKKIDFKDFSFAYCCALKELNLPPETTSLGKESFSFCTSIESIEIPSTLTEYGEKCFKDCDNLEFHLGIPQECF
jgi:hypothetical protein